MKKLIAVTLALVLALSLAACGSGGGTALQTDSPQPSETPSNGDENPAEAPAPPASETPDPEDDNAGASGYVDVINIDFLLGEWEPELAAEEWTHTAYIRIYFEDGVYKCYRENDPSISGDKLGSVHMLDAGTDGVILQTEGAWLSPPPARWNITLLDSMFCYDETDLIEIDSDYAETMRYHRISDTEQPSSSSAAVGDIITFGGYGWRVLDVQDNKALVLSEKFVELRKYDTKSDGTTWEHSTVREYLNGEFYESIPADERAKIAETTVVNNDNPWFGNSSGNNTTDKIFLLSIEEAVQYFGDSGQLADRPRGATSIDDEYNSERIVIREDTGKAGIWWLRSNGRHSESKYFACVQDNGTISIYGQNRSYDHFGVRPALWLNIE